jgi:hypothetical protein
MIIVFCFMTDISMHMKNTQVCLKLDNLQIINLIVMNHYLCITVDKEYEVSSMHGHSPFYF